MLHVTFIATFTKIDGLYEVGGGTPQCSSKERTSSGATLGVGGASRRNEGSSSWGRPLVACCKKSRDLRNIFYPLFFLSPPFTFFLKSRPKCGCVGSGIKLLEGRFFCFFKSVKQGFFLIWGKTSPPSPVKVAPS